MDTDSRLAVRKFVCDNFIVEDGDFADDDSLLDKGILDSTGILELVSFLEETFSIKLTDDEVVPANLDSVDKVCGFLARKDDRKRTATQ